MRGKVTMPRVLEIWEELMLLPIQHEALGNISQLLPLAVKNNLSIYDACYLHTALASGLPLATNDEKLRPAAEDNGLVTIGT